MPGDTGGGDVLKNVTNGDIAGRKVQNLAFRGDVIFEWPLTVYSIVYLCMSAFKN